MSDLESDVVWPESGSEPRELPNNDRPRRSRARPAMSHSATLPVRIGFFLTGIVYPLAALCIAGSSGMTVDSPWQSGKPDVYATMLLQWPGFSPFLPLVLFSAAGLGCWIFRESTSRHPLVRLAIVTGMIVSLQFMVISIVANATLSFIAALIVAPVQFAVTRCIGWAISRSRRFSIRGLLILTTLVAIASALLHRTTGSMEWVIGWPIMIIVLTAGASPVLTPITYLRAFWYLPDASPDTTPWYRGLWPWAIGWLVTWIGSWKLGIDIMLDQYSQLPTQPPQCYVSSAAAHGHPRFVSATIDPQVGYPVNDQMRRLKFLELALASASPRLHHLVRRVYDRVGPSLARTCQSNVWFSDATYLALRGPEWLAVSLSCFVGVDRKRIDCLYGPPKAPSPRSRTAP